ncbi:thiol-activated cytolysin [Maribacter arcticus]|uniref:Thiol-activated cytolysin n=2 Tax=Maribacter arcticus TaxID=561365 RepID=A0A1T5A1L8_9FLAO|nr:thiol-activated cytolysin [Maribacter arcticus]
MNSTKKNMKTLQNLRNKFTSNWGMRSVLFFGAFLVLLLIASCGKDDPIATDPIADTPEEPIALTISEVVNGGNKNLLQKKSELIFNEELIGTSVDKSDDVTTASEDGADIITQRYICTNQRVSLLDGTADFNLLNSNPEVIYPGNLLQGKTLNQAPPLPIVVKRGGGTISYDLVNANTTSFYNVEEVKKSSITDGMNQIIAQAVDLEFPDNLTMEVIDIDSESHLAIEIGISVETFATKTKGNFSFSTDKTYNRKLVKLQQVFYTMTYDFPNSYEEVFDDSVTAEQLAKYIQPDNPATFISSVSYGRIFYMLIESTSSKTEMDLKLKGEYNGALTNVEAEGHINSFNQLKETKVKIIAYGGDGSEGMSGLRTTNEITKRLEETKNITLGVPLSYTVRSLEDPAILVGVKLATEYDKVTCVLKGELAPTNYRGLVDVFEDGIGAAFQLEGTTIVVYNKAGDRYALYTVGGGNAPFKYYVSDPFGPIASIVSTTGTIGAAVRWRDGRIHLFNTEGNSFLKFRYDPENSNLTTPTGSFGDIELDSDGKPKVFFTNLYYGDATIFVGSFPFDANGVEAAVQYTHSSNELSDQRYFSNGGTDTATLRDRIENADYLPQWLWGNPESIVDYELTILPNVGAATTVVSGANTRSDIYFSVAGDQMAIKKAGAWSGPYFIN